MLGFQHYGNKSFSICWRGQPEPVSSMLLGSGRCECSRWVLSFPLRSREVPVLRAVKLPCVEFLNRGLRPGERAECEAQEVEIDSQLVIAGGLVFSSYFHIPYFIP